MNPPLCLVSIRFQPCFVRTHPIAKQRNSPKPDPNHTCLTSFFLRNSFCEAEVESDGRALVDCVMKARRTDTIMAASRHSRNTIKNIGTWMQNKRHFAKCVCDGQPYGEVIRSAHFRYALDLCARICPSTADIAEEKRIC